MGAVLQLQQLPDFIEAESQPLRRLHELHPRHVGAAVASNAAVGPVRRRQQPFVLIEADRLHVDPGCLGEGADGQAFQGVFHSA
ncbi:hypothetical protein G6F59_013539 [Rhizopus arrhizus]|nr:hypothetical protein G6F59_013539 [Rhizopus arrhizus]